MPQMHTRQQLPLATNQSFQHHPHGVTLGMPVILPLPLLLPLMPLAMHCAAPGVVQPPRINVVGRFAAISNAVGSAVGTSATGQGLTPADERARADYVFHTDVLNAADAEQVCRDEGGHLADYQSFTQQVRHCCQDAQLGSIGHELAPA
jgi:hypothetical protein